MPRSTSTPPGTAWLLSASTAPAPMTTVASKSTRVRFVGKATELLALVALPDQAVVGRQRPQGQDDEDGERDGGGRVHGVVPLGTGM